MFTINLNGKIAWVTGGSGGIGKECSLVLAKAGAKVVVSYLNNKDTAQDIVNQIISEGSQAICVHLDLNSLDSIHSAYHQILSTFGSVDLLINSAGVIADNLFLMLEEKDWQKVLEINLIGTVRVIKTVLPDMMLKKFGRIINFSSVASIKGGQGQSNYAASKAALEALSRSLAVEVGKHGIRVNCIAPGVVETQMSKEVIKIAKDQILARQIIKRFAHAWEIAGWVVFLCSEYADFITGQSIYIDGGLKLV